MNGNRHFLFGAVVSTVEYFDGMTDLAEAYPLFTDADPQSICKTVIEEYNCCECHNMTYIHEKDKSVSYDCN